MLVMHLRFALCSGVVKSTGASFFEGFFCFLSHATARCVCIVRAIKLEYRKDLYWFVELGLQFGNPCGDWGAQHAVC